MPKLGRRDDPLQIQYMYPDASVTRNAPFGTGDTPQQRIKIIGGKPVIFREDGHYEPPLWARSPEPMDSPKKASSHGRGTPVKLTALSHKPTNFNPHDLQARVDNRAKVTQGAAQGHQHVSQGQGHQQALQGYQQDPYHSLPMSPNQNASNMNRHSIIPPIGTPSSQYRPAIPQPAPQQVASHNGTTTAPHGTDLRRHLPKDSSYLPNVPARFTKEEELQLRRQIREELEGYNPHRLKDMYVELTGFDHNLTGYVPYTDLGYALLRGQMALSAMTLRLIAAQFVDDNAPHLINYEKILSYVSAALKNEKPAPQNYEPITQHNVERHEPIIAKPAVYSNPITGQDEEYSSHSSPPSPRTKRFPYGAGDNAKLLRLIEQAILDSGDDLDFDKIRSNFGRADRGHRGMLSREQIKTLAYSSNIPLQDSILNRIIDKLDTSNGQYNWEQFIEYLEHVQPMNTGLRIPESKRPTEYVKHYPLATTDWPQNKGDELVPKQKGVFGASPTPARGPPSPEARPAPPRVDRFQQLERQHHQQAALGNVQREFQKLSSEYENAQKKSTNTQEQEQKAWFDRFMKLADALYMNDLEKNGYLTVRETEWLVNKYNDIFELNISESRIQNAIRSHAENENRVPIDKILKTLGTQGS